MLENVCIIFGTVLREYTVVDLHMSIFVLFNAQGKKDYLNIRYVASIFFFFFFANQVACSHDFS